MRFLQILTDYAALCIAGITFWVCVFALVMGIFNGFNQFLHLDANWPLLAVVAASFLWCGINWRRLNKS